MVVLPVPGGPVNKIDKPFEYVFYPIQFDQNKYGLTPAKVLGEDIGGMYNFKDKDYGETTKAFVAGMIQNQEDAMQTEVRLRKEQLANEKRFPARLPELTHIDARASFPIARQHARHYYLNRVVLAGDAAHIHPPIGGLGMNTGLQDAHNLSWKLAGAIQGYLNESVLDTYQAERLPVGTKVVDESDLRALIVEKGGGADSLVNIWFGTKPLGPGEFRTATARFKHTQDAVNCRQLLQHYKEEHWQLGMRVNFVRRKGEGALRRGSGRKR